MWDTNESYVKTPALETLEAISSVSVWAHGWQARILNVCEDSVFVCVDHWTHFHVLYTCAVSESKIDSGHRDAKKWLLPFRVKALLGFSLNISEPSNRIEPFPLLCFCCPKSRQNKLTHSVISPWITCLYICLLCAWRHWFSSGDKLGDGQEHCHQIIKAP